MEVFILMRRMNGGIRGNPHCSYTSYMIVKKTVNIILYLKKCAAGSYADTQAHLHTLKHNGDNLVESLQDKALPFKAYTIQ